MAGVVSGWGMLLVASAIGCGSGGPNEGPPPAPWTVWPDSDRDGYGSRDGGELTVTRDTLGWVANNGDCDDADPTVNPDAVDLCIEGRAEDLDCSGSEDPVDGSEVCTAEFICPYFEDNDGDAFGGLMGPAFGYLDCWFPEEVAEYVGQDDDCDDTNPFVHPDAIETCDKVDNDCDEQIDEGC